MQVVIDEVDGAFGNFQHFSLSSRVLINASSLSGLGRPGL